MGEVQGDYQDLKVNAGSDTENSDVKSQKIKDRFASEEKRIKMLMTVSSVDSGGRDILKSATQQSIPTQTDDVDD